MMAHIIANAKQSFPFDIIRYMLISWISS